VTKQRGGRGSGTRRPGRRRDRHGRGLRSPLVPSGVPLARTRAEVFDDLVLDAVEHLDDRWGAQLAEVEFAVEDVPPLPRQYAAERPVVPLARVLPASGRRAARIVLYRRPLEARAADRDELGDIVHDIVVEQVAELLGLEPETVDPGYAGNNWNDDD
jgi:predicted Zn-dependent protease with MMP-like domain